MRPVHVCGTHGVRLPALEKALQGEVFAGQAEAQLSKGRHKPVVTAVARYVNRRAPGLSRRLAKVMRAHRARVLETVAARWAEITKTEETWEQRVARLVEELNNLQFGLELSEEMSPAMIEA